MNRVNSTLVIAVFINLLLVSEQSIAEQELDFEYLTSLSLEELLNVVVTSQKREEKVQKVSLAVTALSSETLDRWNVFDITRLAPLVPGMVMGRAGYDPRPSIRGARTQQVEHNDPVISTYHNGIYQPRLSQAMVPYVDLERVEIMRGPQGTLFGRNSYGGSMNVISQIPLLNDDSLMIEGEIGDFNHKKFTSSVNFSYQNNSAIRLSALIEQREPYIENIFNSDAGLRDKNTTFLRGQYLKKVSDDSSLLLKFEYWKEDANGYSAFGYKILGTPINFNTGLTNPGYELVPRIGRDDICGGSCGRIGAGLDVRATPGFDDSAVVLSSPYQVANNYKPTQQIEQQTFVAEYNYNLDYAELTLLASSIDFEDLRLEDGDFSHYSSVVEGLSLDSNSKSLEIQLVSKKENDLNWVSGLYFHKEALDYAFLWMDIVDLIDNQPDPSATPKNEWAPWMNKIQSTTNSKAIYGQLNYSLNDDLRFILGLRYTNETRRWNVFGQNPDNLSSIDFSVLEIDNIHRAWNKLTYKIGTEYDLTEQSFLYATFSTGFLSGNAQGAFNGEASYDEQQVSALELAYKSTLLENKLRLNLTYYANDYTDLLATGFKDFQGTTLAIVDNAGSIKARGLEIEIDWLANEFLQLSLRGEISTAEYDDFVTSNPFQEGGETINNQENLFRLDGDQVMYSPDLSFSLMASYIQPINGYGQLTSSLLIHYSGEYRTSDEPYQFSEQPGYSTIDAAFLWELPNSQWQIMGYINNLTNEEVLTRSTRFGGNVVGADYADPKMFGIKIKFSY